MQKRARKKVLGKVINVDLEEVTSLGSGSGSPHEVTTTFNFYPPSQAVTPPHPTHLDGQQDLPPDPFRMDELYAQADISLGFTDGWATNERNNLDDLPNHPAFQAIDFDDTRARPFDIEQPPPIDTTQANLSSKPKTTNLLRERYLPYLYSRESPKTLQTACESPTCDNTFSPTVFRCDDCFGDENLCRSCLCQHHRRHPFHRIRSWTGSALNYEPSNLNCAGFILYLGHNGVKCPRSNSDTKSHPMHIIDVNGVHNMQVEYCNCAQGVNSTPSVTEDKWAQLLSHQIFPATELRPQTGFTFRVLKHFHQINLSSKTSAWDYCQSLIFLTDPIDPENTKCVPGFYTSFVAVMRQWRVLKVLKRQGHMHIDEKLKLGQLVIKCPACPRPTHNMPVDWRNDKLLSLKYATFLAGDGNFHLQQKAGKPDLKSDASLIGDYGFWAPQDIFEQYQNASGVDIQERSSICNTQAGTASRSSTAEKLAVTGIFGVSCRHICLQGSGITDFSKGEKFSVVDVALAPVIDLLFHMPLGLPRVLFSYDLACKYGINFLSRVTGGKVKLYDINHPTVDFLVPKFHLASHKPSCADTYSFNFTPLVGRMSGEHVETIWSSFNWLQYSTREMGAGSRRDILFDHMNFWNWSKTVKMPSRIHRDFADATIQLDLVTERLTDIETTIGAEVVERLQADSKRRGGEQYRPDDAKISYPSRKSALDHLFAQEELSLTDSGIQTRLRDTPSHANFIDDALNLEAKQISYRESVTVVDKSPSEIKRLQRSKQRLGDQLTKHHQTLVLLVPTLSNRECDIGEVHTAEITLPSTFTSKQRELLQLQNLALVEVKLRLAQCHDALDKLRKALGVRSFLTRHARKQHGTARSTRAQDAVSRAGVIVKRWAKTYRSAFKALGRLNVTQVELLGLQELKENDLKILGDWLEGEQYRYRETKLPWIWSLGSKAIFEGENGVFGDAVEKWNEEVVRLEWVHATAAVERWKEEVILLREESRRLVASFTEEQRLWLEKQDSIAHLSYDDRVVRGYKANAQKQAAVQGRLAVKAQGQFALVNAQPSAFV